MQSTGRITLHDCTVELRMPALSSLPPTPGGGASALSLSLEDVAALSAESPTRDLNLAYLGETALIVILVRRPDVTVGATQREALFFALERLSETRVFLGPAPQVRPPPPSRNALRRVDVAPPRSQQGPSVPVLRESEWISCANDSVFAKAMCVLLRTPPEASLPHHLANARGRLRLAVAVRERRAVSEGLSRVSEAISRAARVVGRPMALTAEKILNVRIPLEVRCSHFTAGGSAAKAFVSICARNVSTDAVLSVVPPFVHVTASKVVRETTQKGRIRVAQVAEVPIPSFDVNTATYLDEAFEFVPCFEVPDVQSNADEDEGDGFVTAGTLHSAASEGDAEPVSSSRMHELSAAYEEDLGLFIPSFNIARKQAVQLGPQEEFNFVYAITAKGCTTSAEPPPMVTTIPTSLNASLTRNEPGKIAKKPALSSLPRLAPGTAFETAVAVAWSCTSRDTIEAASAPAPPLERAFSSGGVLALGRRRSVAVRVVAVQWRPPTLVEDVVVSFAGPQSVVLRGHVPVTITVRNQSRKDLNAAALYVQRGSPGEHERLLTPLRTAISLGRVPGGGSARVELLCVALKSGALTLGEVKVVDMEAHGADPENGVPVWCAENSFEVFVVDSIADLRAAGRSVAVGGLE